MLKNKLVIRALEYSALKHKGDNRKGSEIPYIVHLFEVAIILKENALTEELTINLFFLRIFNTNNS